MIQPTSGGELADLLVQVGSVRPSGGGGGSCPPCPYASYGPDLCPDTDPDWLRLHGGKLDSNPDSDHLSHVDCIQIRIRIRDLVLV